MAQVATNGLIVARDLEVVDWLERLPAASASQVAQRFGIGRSQTLHRLQVLRRHGLIARHYVLAFRPPLYTTAARRIGVSGYEHALAIGDLMTSLERDGRTALSEVELRRERTEPGAFESRLSEAQLDTVVACERLPDVVEIGSDQSLAAHEIELTSKGRTRREEILRAYAASDYSRVLWTVPDARLRRLLVDEIAEMGLSDFMQVGT
jgi:hypothetical protein